MTLKPPTIEEFSGLYLEDEGMCVEPSPAYGPEGELVGYARRLEAEKAVLEDEYRAWEETGGHKWYISDVFRFFAPNLGYKGVTKADGVRRGYLEKIRGTEKDVAAVGKAIEGLKTQGTDPALLQPAGSRLAVGIDYLTRLGLAERVEEKLDIKLSAVREFKKMGEPEDAYAIAVGGLTSYASIGVPTLGSVLVGADGKPSLTARLSKLIEQGVIKSDHTIFTADDIELEKWWKESLRFYPENVASPAAIGPDYSKTPLIAKRDVEIEILRLRAIEEVNADALRRVGIFKAELKALEEVLKKERALVLAKGFIKGVVDILDDPQTLAMVAAGAVCAPVGDYFMMSALAGGLGKVSAFAIRLAAAGITFHAVTNALGYAADPKRVDWRPEAFAHSVYAFGVLSGTGILFGKFAEATSMRWMESRPALFKLLHETGRFSAEAAGLAMVEALPKFLDSSVKYTSDTLLKDILSSIQMTAAFRAYHAAARGRDIEMKKTAVVPVEKFAAGRRELQEIAVGAVNASDGTVDKMREVLGSGRVADMELALEFIMAGHIHRGRISRERFLRAEARLREIEGEFDLYMAGGNAGKDRKIRRVMRYVDAAVSRGLDIDLSDKAVLNDIHKLVLLHEFIFSKLRLFEKFHKGAYPIMFADLLHGDYGETPGEGSCYPAAVLAVHLGRRANLPLKFYRVNSHIDIIAEIGGGFIYSPMANMSAKEISTDRDYTFLSRDEYLGGLIAFDGRPTPDSDAMLLHNLHGYVNVLQSFKKVSSSEYEQWLDATLRILPHSPFALMAKGMHEIEMGRYEEAVNILGGVVEKFPESFEARLYLANALMGSGDYNSASQHLQKCEELYEGWRMRAKEADDGFVAPPAEILMEFAWMSGDWWNHAAGDPAKAGKYYAAALKLQKMSDSPLHQ